MLPSLGHISNLLNLRKPTVFCFHSVERAADSNRMMGSMAVTDVFLGDLIKHARSRGIEILSLEQCLARIEASDRRPFICLTFDDGYRDNYDVAFPVLRDLSAPAAIFLATALLDQTSPMWWHPLERALKSSNTFGCGDRWTTLTSEADRQGAYHHWANRFRALNLDGKIGLVDELAACNPHFRRSEAYDSAMTWDMVREMAASGLVTFGGHTVTHPVLATVSTADATHEIAASGDRCTEMIGQPTKYFAYPFGQPDEVGAQAPRIVAEKGFAAAFTTTAATLRPRNTVDRFRLPRIMLTAKSQNLAAIDAYVSGLTEIAKGV